MRKKYQVFISSTFKDLQAERLRVIQTVMKLGEIPVGMEQFPAMDKPQMKHIEQEIDHSDFYILILGGCYGSRSPSSKSYTELEYDYAMQKSLHVLAFLHKSPEELRTYKESNEKDQASLRAFQEKAKNGRLVRHWSDVNELGEWVFASLSEARMASNAVGWIRASAINLKQREEAAEKKVDLAFFDEEFGLRLTFIDGRTGDEDFCSEKVLWKNIFMKIAPTLLDATLETQIGRILAGRFTGFTKLEVEFIGIHIEDFERIRARFMTHKLVLRLETNVRGPSLKLSDLGKQKLERLLVQ